MVMAMADVNAKEMAAVMGDSNCDSKWPMAMAMTIG